MYIRAHVCEVGRERDENGVWKGVLPNANLCDCTGVRLGGINTRTPIRPFKPLDVTKPHVSTNFAKIRPFYELQCNGKKEEEEKP